MSGNYLLDSNIVIDIFRGDSETIARVKKINTVYLPVIVIGELYYGANKSNQTPKRVLEIEQLERTVIILDVTKSTARIYGEIKDELRLKGRLIPENDVWIAAIAKEHNLTLLTRDNHFGNVEGIKIEMM
jgi:tRNA(fMet)-specific endonuclease VapC